MNLAHYEALLPNIPLGDHIPKHIYQTYKSKEIADPTLRDNVRHLQEINPGWEYSLYDDADIEAFILSEYGEKVYSYYQRINPRYGAARADLFRYLLLYRYGGVYLDLKSSLLRPLDEVLHPDDRYILSHWDNLPGQRYEVYGRFKELDSYLPRGEYQQWYIIAAQGHPFLRAVILRVLYNIDHYHPWTKGVGLWGTVKTTGPLAYTQAIYETIQHMPDVPYRFLESALDLGIEYSIFDRGSELRGHRNAIPTYHHLMDSVIILGSPTYMSILKKGAQARQKALDFVRRMKRAIKG